MNPGHVRRESVRAKRERRPRGPLIGRREGMKGPSSSPKSGLFRGLGGGCKGPGSDQEEGASKVRSLQERVSGAGMSPVSSSHEPPGTGSSPAFEVQGIDP